MTDLLRLKHLAFVREYEEDGAVIVEAKSRETKLPPPCCLLRSLDKFTSGYIERLNGLIRRMNVNGAGYSFDVLRRKAILKHDDPPSVRCALTLGSPLNDCQYRAPASLTAATGASCFYSGRRMPPLP